MAIASTRLAVGSRRPARSSSMIGRRLRELHLQFQVIELEGQLIVPGLRSETWDTRLPILSTSCAARMGTLFFDPAHRGSSHFCGADEVPFPAAGGADCICASRSSSFFFWSS